MSDDQSDPESEGQVSDDDEDDDVPSDIESGRAVAAEIERLKEQDPGPTYTDSAHARRVAEERTRSALRNIAARKAAARTVFAAGLAYGSGRQPNSIERILAPTERLIFLIGVLAGEVGTNRGWRTQAAERLNLHPSYLTRLLNGELAAAGPEVLERVARAVGLDGKFFSDGYAGYPDLTEFLDRQVWAPDGSHWSESNPRPDTPEERGVRNQAELVIFHAKALLKEAADNAGTVGHWRAIQLARAVRRLEIVVLAEQLDQPLASPDAAKTAVSLAIECLRTVRVGTT